MVGDRCNGAHWAERVRELRPDATLVYLAGAFLYGFSVEGSWHSACHADWDEQFEQTLVRRLRDLEATQTRVFVATVPFPLGHWDTAEYRARIDCINASLRKAVATVPSSQLLEVNERLCPGGVCTRDMPGVGPLRPDGVHFSINGARGTARWVLQRLKADAARSPTSAASANE
jgi:lysophospholipase L1-like esterase